MTLAQPSNRRIAAHRANGIEVKADERRARAHTRRSTGRFNTGVTTADNKDIELLHAGSDRGLHALGQRGFTWNILRVRTSAAYFPMQKRPNKASSMSSVVALPIS